MIALRRWLYLVSSSGSALGVVSVKTLAIWTLITVAVFLLGRSAFIGLSPHVEEDETRRELRYEVKLALRYIDMTVKGGTCARVEDDGAALSVWERPYEREAGLGEIRPHRVRFFIDDSGDLVAQRRDYTRLLAPSVESIEFHLLDQHNIGIVLEAEANGEMIETRHLGELEGELPR
ncbi:MAG: hypothetical protein ACLFS8_06110 [Clostridia bacterium]